jgi:hypothetical protein
MSTVLELAGITHQTLTLLWYKALDTQRTRKSEKEGEKQGLKREKEGGCQGEKDGG